LRACALALSKVVGSHDLSPHRASQAWGPILITQ